jgi:flavodoxin
MILLLNSKSKNKKITSSILMKATVLFDTSHGNTQKAAEAIASTLKDSGMKVDLKNIKEVKKPDPSGMDLLVIGSPTTFGTMTFKMRFFMRKIKGKDWKDLPFASFDTQNPENIENGDTCASEKMSEKLKDKGLKEVHPILKVLVNDWKGPLLDGEIEKVEKWTRDLVDKIPDITKK